MGVPFFLFSAGVMFSFKNRSPWLHFLKKTGPAWLTGGTFVWLIGLWRGYHHLSWLQFVLGDGSYLYYLTVSFFLLLIFSLLPSNMTLAAFLTGALRVISFHIGAIPSNPYLSVLYWLFYFSLGKFTRELLDNDIDKALKEIAMHWKLILIIWLVCTWIYFCSPEINYFTVMAIPFSLASVAMLFCVGVYAEKISKGLLIDMGKQTFAIYIWHINIAGFVSAKLNPFTYFQWLGPILVLFITYGILWTGNRLARAVRLEPLYKILTGWKPAL